MKYKYINKIRCGDSRPWPLLGNVVALYLTSGVFIELGFKKCLSKSFMELFKGQPLKFKNLVYLSLTIYAACFKNKINYGIEGRVERKNYYLENGRFMNIGKVMNSVKRMEIKRTRGRFERRRQREYENSLMFSNNNQIMKFKRSFVTNYLNKKVNRVKNEMSNIYIDHSCEKIIIEHVLISDFVKLENKEVALVMYCMTSKKRDIALKSKERETMARIVNTGSNEESQGFCEIPYGVVVSSKELANFWLNRMDFLSKKKISEREICSNVKKLEMEVSDRSEVFIVNRGENKWQSFETENFNYNKLQSLNDLMIKVEELFKK